MAPASRRSPASCLNINEIDLNNNIVSSAKIQDGTITEVDVDGGLYSKRSQLYADTATQVLMGGFSTALPVSCSDANDLPLQISCEVSSNSALVFVGQSAATNWTSTVNPAGASCRFFNEDTISVTVTARIYCVTVNG